MALLFIHLRRRNNYYLGCFELEVNFAKINLIVGDMALTFVELFALVMTGGTYAQAVSLIIPKKSA